MSCPLPLSFFPPLSLSLSLFFFLSFFLLLLFSFFFFPLSPFHLPGLSFILVSLSLTHKLNLVQELALYTISELRRLRDQLLKIFFFLFIEKITIKSEPKKNHSTQDSHVVPHHGTNWAALWLTAQIRRDAVLSESYGRGYYHCSTLVYIPILNKGPCSLYYSICNK
jgi:hypothetical protein